jgi:hypothetical protein
VVLFARSSSGRTRLRSVILAVMVSGTVKCWNDDEGWGVLVSPERRGGA